MGSQEDPMSERFENRDQEIAELTTNQSEWHQENDPQDDYAGDHYMEDEVDQECQGKVVDYTVHGGVTRECGSYYMGVMVLCEACHLSYGLRYPQGWKAYPGDVCEHGTYVGGCMVDHICGPCEAGISAEELRDYLNPKVAPGADIRLSDLKAELKATTNWGEVEVIMARLEKDLGIDHDEAIRLVVKAWDPYACREGG